MKLPISYGCQYISDDDIQAVVETLKSDYLTCGPKIPEFEQAFCEYVNAKYSVAVCNATAALHIAIMALGVKEGDNVICTPMTFASSANCIRFCGGNVKFVDIAPETYSLISISLRRLFLLLLRVLTKVWYSWILPVILTTWKSTARWPTNTACGYSKMLVMPLEHTLLTLLVRRYIADVVSIPI